MKFWSYLRVIVSFSVLSICSAMRSRNIDLKFAKCHFNICIFKQKIKNLILALLLPAVKTSCQFRSYTIPITYLVTSRFTRR